MNETELTQLRLSQLSVVRSASNNDTTPASQAQDTEQPIINTLEQHLAPTDGGIAAWRLLMAAFVFETLLWGFPLSFGVFQDHYSKTPEFADNPYIPVVGTVASGLGYLGAPVMMLIIQRFPQYRRYMIWIGWPICILGLALGSFATSLEALIASQGVAYGFGFLIFYYPILSMVDEYWIAKRGMAYGILCAASGLSGSFMPFVLQALLDTYGFRITLRAVAVGLTVLTGPLIPLFKARLPVSRTTASRKINWAFLRQPMFWMYSVANTLQGFGYFFPGLYLPSFATSLSLKPHSGAILLAVMSVCQVCSQFTFGMLSDRKMSINALALSSTAMAAIAVLGVWKVASSLPVLIVFGILYGFFAAGFTAIWARITSSVTDDVGTAAVVFGLLNFQKGLGNVLAGPIGGVLVDVRGGMGSGVYRWVIVFTGACMAGSSCLILLRCFISAR
ncbi:major facilitator superfamily transporter [Aureobasidium sp. EXF-10727]|nr:major facilitator superfamily transporter [Aureobasidium sp. EXF-10727]